MSSLCQTFCAGKTAVHRLAPKDIDKGTINRPFSLRRQGQLLANNDALSASSQALFAQASIAHHRSRLWYRGLPGLHSLSS